MEPDNSLAIVPYKPLHIPQEHGNLGLLCLVAGPVLPPAMIWQRTFASLLQEIYAMEVPRNLHFLPSFPIIYSKRSWHMAFDDRTMSTTFTFVGEKSPLFRPLCLLHGNCFPQNPLQWPLWKCSPLLLLPSPSAHGRLPKLLL